VTGTSRASPWPRAVLLDAWPLLLAVVLCWPLLAGDGYPLARDLVFVPRQPWTDAVLGLDGAAPRAVPLDAVVAMLTAVVDGGTLARFVLPVGLAAAGWGAHRLVRDLGTVGRLVTAGVAVWIPYVVERTSLGQWALLLAYAALPWLLLAAERYAERGRLRDYALTTVWLAAASLTPTGGLLGSAAVLATGARRSVRTCWLALACLTLQLPWVLPAVLGAATRTSDPLGVEVFASGSEGPAGLLGTIVALLGTGGVWDAGSVPISRDQVWGPLTALAALTVVLVGHRVVASTVPRRRLGWLAAAGLLLAVGSSLPGGEPVLEWLVEHAPGAGLLRDAQKFVAPYALLVSVSAGACAHRAVRSATRHGTEVVLAVAVVALAAPVVLLPDGARETWPTLDPVTYPPGLAASAETVEKGGGGVVATLPWRSYRRFDWGHGLVSSDPAARWFDEEVLVSTDLQVGDRVVRGEDERAARLGDALATGPVVDALAGEGVGWALVYRDDPQAGELELTGLEEVYADGDLALYRVPGVAAPDKAAVTGVRRGVVLMADVLAGLLVVAGLVVLVATARRPGSRPRDRAAW
jgi:hypothetical protein